jgi:hypothetical protein
MTLQRTIAMLALAGTAAFTGSLAVSQVATAGHADGGAPASRSGGVRAAQEDTPLRARGSVVFRTERYILSDRATVTTSPTTIRIVDDAARNESGHATSLYIQFGYETDPGRPNALTVMSGVAIRGYDFATGQFDPSQRVSVSKSGLYLDAAYNQGATHAWGRLNSATERGVDLDIHGLQLAFPS